VGIGLAAAAGLMLTVLVGLLVVVLLCAPASAAVLAGGRLAPALGSVQSPDTVPYDLPTVIDNATGWLVKLLAGLATFFLTLGGVRYLSAGDPSEVERAKGSFKNAGIGYGLAILAPVILAAIKSILGVS
jgi:hypothetical protein